MITLLLLLLAPLSEKPFNVAIISNEDTLLLYCYSHTIQIKCTIRYSTNLPHTTVSEPLLLSNNSPLSLDAQNNTWYYFEAIAVMSPTLEMVLTKSHYHSNIPIHCNINQGQIYQMAVIIIIQTGCLILALVGLIRLKKKGNDRCFSLW